MGSRHMVIPVFVPHKGCPFDCIYCNQKTISGQMDEMTVDRMRTVIEEHLAYPHKNTEIEIGFYGGSFTGIDRSEQINFLKAAFEYVKRGAVKGIRLSTRPDYINTEILEYLKLYGVKTIELGVQSLDGEVLEKSCRGHSAEDVYKASALIREKGFALGIQTMLGLPGDTREKALKTARDVADIGPEVVRIYPTLVIKGTYLEKLYMEGSYRPFELEEAVDVSAQLLEIYRSKGINVIRIGLQPTDAIREDGDVAAGPFHPAFRQLVESRLLLNRIIGKIEEEKLYTRERISIYTAPEHISDVVGQRRCNIKFLKQKYGFKEVKVLESSSGNFLSVSPITKN